MHPCRRAAWVSLGYTSTRLRALQALGKRVNHPTHLVDAVLSVNEEQKRLVWRRLHKLYGSVKGLNLGVLGLTYKPGDQHLAAIGRN